MLRLILAGAMALAVTVPAAAQGQRVNGYYKSNGTYVQPHYRSAPDSSRYNNYSTQGNVNPYTGRAGTVSPYGSSSYGGNSLYGSSSRCVGIYC